MVARGKNPNKRVSRMDERQTLEGRKQGSRKEHVRS